MSKQSTLYVDLEKLKTLAASLKTRPSIQVGVFSGKNGREDDMTNASLAAIHELGDMRHGLPPRSMLSVPIKDHAEQIMSSVRGLAHQLVTTKEGLPRLWKLVGVAAEKIVLQAFDTEGFGKWAPLKYKTLLSKLKGSLKKRKKIIGQIYTGEAKGGILILSGQLRRAFSSRVVMKF